MVRSHFEISTGQECWFMNSDCRPRETGAVCHATQTAPSLAVALLQRSDTLGVERWQPRDCEQLSEQLSLEFGLPIEVSKKAGGLRAICNALNEGDVARAQIAAVLLGIPEPAPLTKNARSESEMIKFIRDLDWSGLIKADWDPAKHPRWPAGGTPKSGRRVRAGMGSARRSDRRNRK